MRNLKNRLTRLQTYVKKLKVARTKAEKAALSNNTKQINFLLSQMLGVVKVSALEILTVKKVNLSSTANSTNKSIKLALKVKDPRFTTNKNNALKSIAAFLKLLK